MPVVNPSLKPELLIFSVKTKLALWWLSGMKTRIAMMIAVPITCHQTEIALNNASSRWEKMLIRACSARITA